MTRDEMFDELLRQENTSGVLGFIALERIGGLSDYRYREKVIEIVNKYFHDIENVLKDNTEILNSRAATREPK